MVVHLEGTERGWKGGDRNFRFEARWLQEDGCEDIIRRVSERSYQGGGSGVTRGLQSVAKNISVWSREVVGELDGRIKKARGDLERCMKAPVSEGKIREEARLRAELEGLKEKKYTQLKQRAHMWWLRGGNKNIKYLQSVASARKKSN